MEFEMTMSEVKGILARSVQPGTAGSHQSSVQLGETTTAPLEYEDDPLSEDARQAVVMDKPDVLLDALVRVDEIHLEVAGLKAHVSVLAELADLLKLSVGADVELEKVTLTIKGVQADAHLEVRLEQVRAILDKALSTIMEHPEILGRVLDPVIGPVLNTVDKGLYRPSGEARAVVQEAVGEEGAVTHFTKGEREATAQVGETTPAVGRETDHPEQGWAEADSGRPSWRTRLPKPSPQS
jgi:hypothetical protein